MSSAARSRVLILVAALAAPSCSGRDRGGDDDPGDGDADGDGDGDGDGDTDGDGDATGDAGPASDAGADAEIPEDPCDPSLPFGAPEMVAAFADTEDAEPWVSGDGLVLVMTHVDEDFGIGLEIASRGTRDDAFSPPARLAIDGWTEDASQAGRSPDGASLYFLSGGSIVRASATDDPGTFADPEVVEAAWPADTQFPEFPRAADRSLYVSLRESNHRRSLYALDLEDGSTDPILFDAGDIFTFAISPNGLFLYVTFWVDALEVYRTERESADEPFSLPEPVHELALDDPELSGFAITGVTDDDCEVFGWTYDLTGTDTIWHARR